MNYKIIEPEIVSEIIREVTKDKILPRFKNLDSKDIDSKSYKEDLVTIADVEAEEEFNRKLKEILPGADVVGEEAFAKGNSILHSFDRSEFVWTVDPIDGTYNFVNDENKYGVIISLVQNKKTVQSWLYNIPDDQMFTAIKGEGSFLDGKKLQVNKTKPLDQSVLNHGYFNEKNSNIKDKVKSVARMRCTMQDAIMLVTGQIDVFVRRLITPWDHSACALMVKEAGGIVKLQNGRKYYPHMYGESVLVFTVSEETWKNVSDNYYE